MFSERLNTPKGEAAHSLRHNFITRCRSAEMQDSMISKLVGHKVKGMTARYGIWTLEDSSCNQAGAALKATKLR